MKKTLANSRSILVIRPDGMGDLILMIPFLRALRNNFPTAKITLLTLSAHQDLLRLCPYIDEVMGFTMTRGHRPQFIKLLNFSRKHLWKHPWDAALYPRWGLDCYGGALLTFLSRAPFRAGFCRKAPASSKLGDLFSSFVFHRQISDTHPRHELDRNLFFIEQLGCVIENRHLEFWLDSQDQLKATTFLKNAPPADETLAIGLGACQPMRRWPAENWAELIEHYMNLGNTRVLILGGSDVKKEASVITNRLSLSHQKKLINTVGRSSWQLSAALIEQCSVYAGHDTGLSHIAAALNKPVILLSPSPELSDPTHPNAPERFGVQCQQSITLRPSAGSPLGVKTIPIEQVWDALKTIKRRWPKAANSVENSQ